MVSSLVAGGVEAGDRPTRAICASSHRFHCFARAPLDFLAKPPTPDPSPTALTPQDILAAYDLPASGETASGAAAHVVIVGAYDDPTAESDLAKFRVQYGLPACTTANGCFQKLNENGASAPLPGAPPSYDDWTVESALDLAAVSAACPACSLTLIESNTDDTGGPEMQTAEATAIALVPDAISNSWGQPELGNETDFNAVFQSAKSAIVFASGDSSNSAGAYYPAIMPFVFSIGATTLNKDSSPRGFSEIVWSASGGGCSVQESSPLWQSGAPASACPGFRADNDLAADGDPFTGLAVYDSSYANGDAPGWLQLGGTSLSAPLVAGIFASTGLGKTTPSEVYGFAADFNDITTGSNCFVGDNGTSGGSSGGSTGSIEPFCTAAAGWDEPSGLGSPIASKLAASVAAAAAAKSSSGGGSSGGSGGSSSSGSGDGGALGTTGGDASSSGASSGSTGVALFATTGSQPNAPLLPTNKSVAGCHATKDAGVWAALLAYVFIARRRPPLTKRRVD